MINVNDAQVIPWSPRRVELLAAGADMVVASLCLVALRLLPPPPEGVALASGTAWSAAGVAFAVGLLMWLHRLGHYERRQPLANEIGDLFGVGVVLAAIDLGLATVAGVAPAAVVLCWGGALILLPTARIGLRRWLDARGVWRRPAVVVGTGENALAAARALTASPSLGLPVVAFAQLPGGGEAAPGPGVLPLAGASVPVMPVAQLLAALGGQAGAVPHVVIAPDPGELPACLELLERLAAAGCDLDFVPPLARLPVADAGLFRLVGGEIAAIRLRDPLSAPLSRLYKRAFDLVLGGLLLTFTAPLLAGIALLIALVDGRPVLFRQERIGMNGRPFACLKFRTMVPDAEARLQGQLAADPVARSEWERTRKLKNDPRVSALGRWLRRSSLDELPQLWNVVRGDMSLIGPRPILASELDHYGERIVFYLRARPGLSGLWQVSGRNELDYRQRVDLDCHYVRNWTPWWDIALLLATVRVVLSRRGAY
jgi:undecaprenyl-phosphate galactose phosphotransferase